MIQELITYAIIGLALTMIVIKARNKFWKKKKQEKITSEAVKNSHQHNCSDCSAECVLRDAVTPTTGNNKDICRKIETASASDRF